MKTSKWIISFTLIMLVSCSHSQSDNDLYVGQPNDVSILDSLGLNMEVARDPQYRFQFLATSISDGEIRKTVSYGTDKYYYPASLVKLPAALVLLELLNERGISLDAFPIFDTIQSCGSTKFAEICKNNHVSFRTMLSELLVVSDNHFYNALYHIITPAELNKRLKEKGFKGINIYRAFTGCERTDQLRTYSYKIYEGGDAVSPIYVQESSVMDSSVFDEVYSFSEDRLFGSKHENSDGEIVDGPYDLNYQIEIPLDQMHQIMLSLYFPHLHSSEIVWNIRPKDLVFIQDLLGKFPSEIKTKKSVRLFDYKYIRNKLNKAEARTFGKLGLSYGFASETVYVPSEGFANGIMITYSVYVNSNDIVNDGEYDYESVARPFAEELFAKILDWHNE